MATTVGRDLGVEAPDVGGDFGNGGEALLGNGAVLTRDLLARDQLLAVAEAAVRRTGRHNIEQPHFVLVEHALDGAVVHLKARVFGAREILGLFRIGLHNATDGRARLRQLKVVARDLDGHALLDIALGALEDAQLNQFVRGVKAAHVLRRPLIEKRRKAVDDVALVAGVLDR